MITVGCDPELFLKKEGKFVSAHGLIPGTKEDPHPVPHGAVQVDGLAVEFNIDPATTLVEFRRNIREVLTQLEGMLPEYSVEAIPLVNFGEEYMRTQPAEGLELGCDPDYNAYTGEANDRLNGDVPFRTAGGHVHIGWTTDAPLDHPEHLEACRMLTRELDFYLGLPSLFWDREDGRRAMYGMPGAFRAKSFGVEYRSLSNAWLTSDRLIDFVYSQTNRAFTNLADGRSIYNMFPRIAMAAMSNNDRDLALVMLRHDVDILGNDYDWFMETFVKE